MSEGTGESKLVGLLAQFSDPASIISAAQRMREAGYRRMDAYTPFPIHRLDKALGIRPTRLPWLVLGAGVTGGAVALLGQWWTNGVDYPFRISGKPLLSLPANIPVTFELIILFSAFAAFLGMLALNRLPRFSNPVFSGERFQKVTSDSFFLIVEASDPKFSLSETESLLQSFGAVHVETCRESTESRGIPRVVWGVLAAAGCLALLPPLWIAVARARTSEKPRWHTFTDMDYQARLDTQAQSSLFADGRAMRLPVAGVVARGELDTDERLYRGIDPEPEKVVARDPELRFVSEDAADTKPPATSTSDEPSPGAESPEAAEPSVDEANDAPQEPETPEPNWTKIIPLPVSQEMMQRGRERFNIYCATCHGRGGDGDGVVTKRAMEVSPSTWGQPTSLSTEYVRSQPVGKLFNTITNGIRRMPGYGAQITVEDRWAIVLYLRALQRSQFASLEDLDNLPAEKRTELRGMP